MLLRRIAISSARIPDTLKACERHLRTRLSLWHGRDCEDVGIAKVAQTKKVNAKLPVIKMAKTVRIASHI